MKVVDEGLSHLVPGGRGKVEYGAWAAKSDTETIRQARWIMSELLMAVEHEFNELA